MHKVQREREKPTEIRTEKICAQNRLRERYRRRRRTTDTRASKRQR